jgi:hypothetical protein
MTPETNDWLKWFDSWTGRCPDCGARWDEMLAVDDRQLSRRKVTIECLCGWTYWYQMSEG